MYSSHRHLGASIRSSELKILYRPRQCDPARERRQPVLDGHIRIRHSHRLQTLCMSDSGAPLGVTWREAELSALMIVSLTFCVAAPTASITNSTSHRNIVKSAGTSEVLAITLDSSGGTAGVQRR